jgi:hypothetical protein
MEAHKNAFGYELYPLFQFVEPREALVMSNQD